MCICAWSANTFFVLHSQWSIMHLLTSSLTKRGVRNTAESITVSHYVSDKSTRTDFKPQQTLYSIRSRPQQQQQHIKKGCSEKNTASAQKQYQGFGWWSGRYSKNSHGWQSRVFFIRTNETKSKNCVTIKYRVDCGWIVEILTAHSLCSVVFVVDICLIEWISAESAKHTYFVNVWNGMLWYVINM